MAPIDKREKMPMALSWVQNRGGYFGGEPMPFGANCQGGEGTNGTVLGTNQVRYCSAELVLFGAIFQRGDALVLGTKKMKQPSPKRKMCK